MDKPTNSIFESSRLQSESDVDLMRVLIKRFIGKLSTTDFEENLRMPTIRKFTCLWRQADQLIAFAYIDDYNNLKFEIDTEYRLDKLENDIVCWGIHCMRERNMENGTDGTLDASCALDDFNRIAMLTRLGFVREPLRTLRYERLLSSPIIDFLFPEGFFMRSVAGQHEVEDLVKLHRAAFGTDSMTVQERLAMMNVPGYTQELDLIAISPDSEFAAFCVCGIDMDDCETGYTDPVGTHPRYQKMGLGKAILAAGLHALKSKEVRVVELGTSSENTAMMRLAKALGFEIVSEKLWFSLHV